MLDTVNWGWQVVYVWPRASLQALLQVLHDLRRAGRLPTHRGMHLLHLLKRRRCCIVQHVAVGAGAVTPW